MFIHFKMNPFIKQFSEIRIHDIAKIGGENASLGEMYTQLTLGIDRDSQLMAELFDENNKAAKAMVALTIEKAKKTKTKIGLCGQAQSDFPEFTQFLVEQGIDSISFNPDALLKGIENTVKAEKHKVSYAKEEH